MIGGMIVYSFYMMFAVGLAVLLTAVFRRLRRDDDCIAPPEENAAFARRMATIEKDYDLGRDEARSTRADSV